MLFQIYFFSFPRLYPIKKKPIPFSPESYSFLRDRVEGFCLLEISLPFPEISFGGEKDRRGGKGTLLFLGSGRGCLFIYSMCYTHEIQRSELVYETPCTPFRHPFRLAREVSILQGKKLRQLL